MKKKYKNDEEYREKKKAILSIRRKEKYKNDPEYREKVKESNKKKEQTENVKKYRKEYRKRPERKRMQLIRAWQTQNIKHSKEFLMKYYDEVYFEAKTCESCNNSFENCRKVLDHDHLSGCIRNTICNKCNCIRSTMDRNRYVLMLEIHRKFK